MALLLGGGRGRAGKGKGTQTFPFDWGGWGISGGGERPLQIEGLGGQG